MYKFDIPPPPTSWPHSTPGLVCLTVVVWGVLHAHLVLALYEDPTSLWADNCAYIYTHTMSYVSTYISVCITYFSIHLEMMTSVGMSYMTWQYTQKKMFHTKTK